MKKGLFLSAILISPVLTFATPACETTDPNFCSCFISSAVSNCLKNGPRHHIPPTLCKPTYILPHIRTTPNMNGFCTQYRYMFPNGATHKDCVDGVSYAKAHC